MTGDLAAVVADARALWRRDRPLLWPVSALFLFLPPFALLLLVPPVPDVAPGTSVEAWGKALEPWVARYGGAYVLATLAAQYGALALVSLYMPLVPAVGGAMTRAAWRFPRALLAGLLVTVPCGAAALLSLSVPLLPMLVLPAIVYVLARSSLANPVILAKRGTGAIAAVARSWQLTRGRGLAVALLVGGITLGGQVAGSLLVALERGVRASSAASPVLLFVIDAGAAGVTWAAALALALVQVVLYRRLAR